MIAGLEDPSAGQIRLDGADMTGLPTHKRDFGMVFQSLALFPHLNVSDNIGYALRIRGVAAEQPRRRIEELLSLVHLQGYAYRPVRQLTGGHAQRQATHHAPALPTKPLLPHEPAPSPNRHLTQ